MKHDRTIAWALAAGLAVAAGACSSDPVDAAGTYTVAITNGPNGCGFEQWTEGDQATGIGMVITQDGADVQATVQGLTGAYLDLVLGSHVFVGTVDGNDLDLEIIGTRSATQGNCTYTVTARVNAELSGDALSGTIDYVTVTNHHPECGTKESCASQQLFNGTRPPTP
jgi:hypothetical protein